MQSTLVKINEKGDFCPFPGVTVVSAIKAEDYQFWEELYNLLNKCELAKQYYSWLPFESYHMTTLSLYTKLDVGAPDWKGFIEKNLPKFQEIAKLLDEKSFTPDIELGELEVGYGVLFNLKLPEDQQQLINSVTSLLGFSDKLPHWPHLALAYRYKETTSEINKAIRTELEPVLGFLGKKIQLEPPKLCYFNDMKAFIPWNGEKYPFED